MKNQEKLRFFLWTGEKQDMVIYPMRQICLKSSFRAHSAPHFSFSGLRRHRPSGRGEWNLPPFSGQWLLLTVHCSCQQSGHIARKTDVPLQPSRFLLFAVVPKPVSVCACGHWRCLEARDGPRWREQAAATSLASQRLSIMTTTPRDH